MKRFFTLLLSIGFLLTGCGGGGGGGETASGSSGYNTTTAPAAGGGGAAVVADTVLNGQFTAGGSPAAASLEQTLVVTVQAVGNANKYFIDGVQQDTLALEVGITYTLDQSDNSNAGHPLRFSITDDGTHSGGVEYTADITTNGTAGQAGAYTRIAATAGTPNALFYYCTNHAGMGGQAGVTNVGGANNAAVNGVQGLSYATETQSGITDSTGAFTYKSGETIQFSIGNFLLGDAVLAVEDMTPVDLVPGVVLPTMSYELDTLYNDATRKPANSSGVAFNKLVNMLVFLHSIDSDKDASNDISIADGIGTLLEGVNIDFSKDTWTTSKNQKLKTVLVDAAAQNLVDSALIKPVAIVLNNFYSAQGVNHSFASKAGLSRDNDGDGSADFIFTYTYDDNGKRLTQSNDSNADGAADQIYTYTYDSDGNRLTESTDNDADGAANSTTTYTYDDNGNRLSFSRDGDLDGIVDRILTYTYDSYDNLLSYSVDDNGDGISDAINTYTYDSDGNMLTDSFDDGAFQSINTYTYDSSGNQLTNSYDEGGEGTADEIDTYTYDTNGNMLTRSFDPFGDGTDEEIYTYTYDSNGNQLTYSIDANGDGTADEIRTYTYDISGNMLTESYDFNGDGTATRVFTWTWSSSVIGAPLETIIP